MRRATALVIIGLFSRAADAVEGESSFAVTGVFATMTLTGPGADPSGSGGGLMLDLQRAISDTFWLRAAVSGSVLSLSDEAGFMGTASFGLTYTVDVLKYVPYVGIGGGAVVVGGGGLDAEIEPYIELGVGLDIIVSTSFSWGVDARFSSFLGSASVFLVGPRVSWHWGYF